MALLDVARALAGRGPRHALNSLGSGAAVRIRVRAEEREADGVRGVPQVKKNSSKRACRPAGI